MQQRLAKHGLVISDREMSGLWSDSPTSIKLGDLHILDVICVALDCGVEELLLHEPDKVAQPAPLGRVVGCGFSAA